eukprot:355370-Chlamydomonas_euryale.AAC.9
MRDSHEVGSHGTHRAARNKRSLWRSPPLPAARLRPIAVCCQMNMPTCFSRGSAGRRAAPGGRRHQRGPILLHPHASTGDRGRHCEMSRNPGACSQPSFDRQAVAAGGPMAAPGDGGGRLAAAMAELGPSCAKDVDAFRALLARMGGGGGDGSAVDAAAAARTLGVVASSPDSGWNGGAVGAGLAASAPGLDWESVADALDHDGFAVASEAGFTQLLAGFRAGCGSQPALRAVVGRPWRNVSGQLSLLHYACRAPPETYTFEGADRKLEGVPAGTPNQAWLC